MSHPVPIAPTHATRELVDALVDELGAELDAVSAALSDTIHAHLGELDDDLRTWTRQSTRANLGLAVSMLRDAAPATSAVAPPEALGYAREYVRRGLSLELLQRAYRIGQARLSRLCLERLRAATGDPDRLVAAFGYLSDWLFASVEEVERQLTAAYLREREQWVRGAAAMRAAEVRALLSGADVDVAETSKRLGYELDRHHVAYLVWSDDDADAAEAPGAAQARFSRLERAAGDVAARLGAAAPLTVPQGDRALACWAGTLRPPDVAAAPADALDGTGVALGDPGHGVEGFRVSHGEAQLARRVAGLAGARGAWTAYADVGLEALAVHDLDQARRFVARELGALAGCDPACVRLATTLRTFLEEGCSYVRAGRRLGVHENTVAYRVHRAEELLGHRAAERTLELRVALRLAPVTG